MLKTNQTINIENLKLNFSKTLKIHAISGIINFGLGIGSLAHNFWYGYVNFGIVALNLVCIFEELKLSGKIVLEERKYD